MMEPEASVCLGEAFMVCRNTLCSIVAGLLMCEIYASDLVRASRSAQIPAPVGAAFIFGRVVDSFTHAPIADATVTLTNYRDTSDRAGAGASGSAPIRVLTNEDGAFLFARLRPGRYGLQAWANGYLGGGYLQARPAGASHFIDLADGAQVNADIQVWKYAVVRGRLIDQDGEPVVAGNIRILRRSFSGGRLRLANAGSAASDDRGMYRASGLTPGDYVVAFMPTQVTIPTALSEQYATFLAAGPSLNPPPLVSSLRMSGLAGIADAAVRYDRLSLQSRSGVPLPTSPDGTHILNYRATFFPNASTSSEATVLHLAPGEQRDGVDLTLSLAPSFSMSGVLTDGNKPVPYVALSLVPPAVDDFSTEDGIETATTLTDGDGTFTFLAVPPGNYVLRAFKPVLQTSTPNGTDVPLWAARPVTVNSEIHDLNVALEPSVQISGKLAFAGPAKASSAQLSQVSIRIVPAGPRSRNTPQPIALRTEEFRSTGFVPGPYIVDVGLPPGWSLLSVKHGPSDVSDQPMILQNDVTDLVVNITDHPAGILGSVYKADNTGDARADVIVFPADSESWRKYGGLSKRARLVSTTKQGTYSISDLPPGKYHIAAVDASVTADWQDPAFLAQLQPFSTKIEIGLGEHKTQNLKSVTALAGR